jgi:hypothetical protein
MILKYFKDMKYKNLILIIVTGLIATFTSCKSDNADNTLTIDRSEIKVLADGGITLINVTTDLEWNASVNADWVKISPASGSGSELITITFDKRTGERRTATITFIAGAIVETVNIEQRGNTTDEYYKTGEVITLHRHTTGNGIPIVIIGDGFDREDCRRGGVYEDNCRKLASLFLSMPIIRDYKNYFDIRARVDISRERGARNCTNTPDNCPDNAYGSGHADLNWNKIYNNATLTAGKPDRWIIFMANGMIGGAAPGDMGIYSANEPNKPYWMMHEFAGHAFGKLPDLYYVDETGLMDDAARDMFDRNHALGELLMFDWHSDPRDVYWKNFIGRSGYSNVGVYPAGYYDMTGTYKIMYGEVFSCEEVTNSVMYGPTAHYSVMERYQIWRKIQFWAGFTTTTIDEFITYDIINLIDADWSWDKYDNWTDDRIWNWND